MIRAQFILEEEQREWLAEEARQQSISMSALVRKILVEAIDRRRSEDPDDDPLWDVVGIGSGPNDGVNSDDLDAFLYQAGSQDRPLRRVSEDDTTDN